MTDEELTAIEEVISRAQQSSGMAAGHDVAMIHAPALLAEVRSLRAEREKADKALTQALRSLVETRDERDALRKDAAIIFALREPSEIVVDAMREHIYNYAVTSTQDLRYALRAALTAAMAVQPITGDTK